MDQENLKMSLEDYESQIFQVNEALKVTPIGEEFDSLSTLQSDLQELIDLTKESLEAVAAKKIQNSKIEQNNVSNLENGDKNAKYNDALVDEYALFMAEMADTGAFEDKDKTQNDGSDVAEHKEEQTPVDIEEELSSLEGMKCSAMHCHKWGGAPSLHNAMVCSVVRDHEDNTNFYSLKVRVMFTNPTHKEMVPCPFYLDGECKFTDEQCRYSHGEVVPLSSLSEAVDPNFSLLKPGCRVLAKLQQTDEPTSSKSSEKYLLWHRAVVKTVDSEKNTCEIKLEHESGMKNEGKNYHTVEFSNVFPLTGDDLDSDSDSDSSSPDVTYPYHDDATSLPGTSSMNTDVVDRALTHTPGAARLGDWEKHTKGIGSKLLLSMGYVFGGGLGPAGNGIVEPVPCTIKPKGRSLDHCMRISECNNDDADPFKTEKKLLRLQKKQEEKEKKAYERAQDRERHNVFNVLNSVFASNSASSSGTTNSNSNFPPHKKANKMSDIKSSTCKNLNIENFKITEELIRLEKDISKLQSSLSRNEKGSDVYKSIVLKLALKSKELEDLKKVQSKVADEQSLRKDKRKLTVF